jgi:prepilin-type N-terminal cleavage/methylation domain-containing protein
MALLPTKRHGRLRAGGFTLLEIVVTLVLLGLAAALVAPAFRTETSPDEGLRSILALTREAAVRRSQTLVLQVDARGSWRIAAAGESASIAGGRFIDGTKDLRIRVNPLGACFNEGKSGTIALDAVACAVTGTGTGGR